MELHRVEEDYSVEWRQGLQDKLLAWFDEAKRDYPWRHTNNPFRILVAEKLLQQTRVIDLVVQSYNQIFDKYTTLDKLAGADIEDVRKIIRPLGLSFRAAHLVEMAKDLLTLFNGRVPDNYKDLMKLTGVGEYAARAVLSFAYHQDVAIIDTNVGRFLFRIFNIERPFPANPSRKKYLADLAQFILPVGKSKEFNLAVLDFCAAICRPNIPRCFECPLRDYCRYENKTAN